MLRHEDIWRAVDLLGAKYGMSASGLARRAGLDPTTFNKSKRLSKDGKRRWPSTESIAKILEATGASLAEFVSLIGQENAGVLAQRLPVTGYNRAGSGDFFNPSGHPVGDGWDEMLAPHVTDPNAYGLEIGGDGLEPVFRDGDVLIVSPAASIRRGDRVVVRTGQGDIAAKQLLRRSALKIEFKPVNRPEMDLCLEADELAWMSRIIWVSQ